MAHSKGQDAAGRRAPVSAVGPLRFGIVLLDEFTLAAFAGFLDALRLASDYGGHSRQILVRWVIMSAEGRAKRSSAETVHGELRDLGDAADFDYVAVCGGNSYTNPRYSARLSAWLVDASRAGAVLLGICSGTFAIAHAGLAGGRTVCVHWNVIESFKTQFPDISCRVDRLFIDAGSLITCAGSTAAIDLALYLVSRHYGRDKVQQVLRHMMLYETRPARLPQAHFYINLDRVTDRRVHKAVYYMEQRIDDLLTADEVADYVGVSCRQLDRLFKSALGRTAKAVHRTLRLQYGRWQVANTQASITDIAVACGFSDSSHFSREFKAAFGETPRGFRTVARRKDRRMAWAVAAPPLGDESPLMP